MQTNFGRGTVYDLTGKKMLAEVYYFIQAALPGDDFVRENQGFFEPVLEYEQLSEILQSDPKMMLEMEDGYRLEITANQSRKADSGSPSVFFRTGVTKGPAKAGPSRRSLIRKNRKLMHS